MEVNTFKIEKRSRRKTAKRSEVLTSSSALFTGESALLTVANCDDIEPLSWFAKNGAEILTDLPKRGAVLMRNIGLENVDLFHRTVTELCSGNLLDYQNRSTPRSQVGKHVYTSTEYPPEYAIPLHNENAYTNSWPGILFFFSNITADEGGETPICDSRKIYQSLSPSLRRLFEDKGVRYVRNYGGLDLSWQEVFQTEKKREVERFCQQNNIQFEWGQGEKLRTWQNCQASVKHPVTGEMCWFNQAHLFHVSALPGSTQQAMLSAFQEDELPRNAFFGDGEAIPVGMLEEIRASYKKHTLKFSWQKGDLMIIDNLLYAHGREPFKGFRQVMVAMSDYPESAPSNSTNQEN